MRDPRGKKKERHKKGEKENNENMKKLVVKLRKSRTTNVRSKDSEGTTSCACNTGRDNKKRQAQNMDDVETLFSLNDADGCREMKC